MRQADEITLVAPCGMHCGDCRAYRAKDDLSIMQDMIAKGVRKEILPCSGCRPLKGNCPFIVGTCETYACIDKRGFELCFECPEFPCAKLNPAADRANVLPHNMKVFNLCFIKQQGLAKWLVKLPEITQRYYRGRMVIGKGPQLE
jgi:hypothetical protein